jgi:NAD(P)-dependent dehydrogenase (short-subunit alcohol dehydrogenase family)
MHSSLKNKTALVTVVSSGIGREIAQLLAELGARVFGSVRNPKSASPIRGVDLVGMDVTDDKTVNAAVQTIVQNAGPVQLLVNNAGYSLMGRWKKPVLMKPVSNLKQISSASCV